jgi:hypothetical protein
LFVVAIEAAMKHKPHIINNLNGLLQIKSFCKF